MAKSKTMVQILTPISTESHTTPYFEARVRLTSGADPATFHVLVNGVDVTRAFQSRCEGNECLETAQLNPWYGLREGRNVLVVHVKDEDQNLDLASEEFQVSSSGVLLGDSNQTDPPYAVFLNTSFNNGVQTGIQIGPPVPYLFHQFYPNTCAAGSLYVVVIDNLYLTPASASMPNGTYSTCQSAANAANFLKTIPSGLLVIGASSSSMTPIDASAIGGSKSTSSQARPYQIIGVAGASGGAYESFTSSALNGSLVRGSDSTYFFAPTNFTEFALTPNDLAQGGKSSLVIGQLFTALPPNACPPNAPSNNCIPIPLPAQPGTTYTAPDFTGNDAGAAGGFWVIQFNRQDLSLISSASFGTNHPGNNGAATAAMNNLTSTLSAPGNNLIFLTIINSPVGSVNITAQLGGAIDVLGGNRYVANHLASVNGNAKQAVYALVSSTDSTLPYDQRIEASPLIAGQNQTGVIRGVLGPDRQNLFAPVHAERQALITYEGTQQPNAPVNFDFYPVIYAQPSAYPSWANTTQGSYYAQASEAMTPSFSSTCVTDPTNSAAHCNDIRYYYNQGNPPGALACGTAVPKTLNGVDPNDPDWKTVYNELELEHAWVCSVENEYNDVKDLATDTAVLNLNLQNTLNNAAQDLQSFAPNAPPPPNLLMLLNSKALSRWAALLPMQNIAKEALAGAPDIGPVFGLGSAIFSTISVFTKKTAGPTPPNEQFESTLSSLNNDVTTYGPAVQASALVLFRHILADYGKLQAFGANYGAFVPGWNGDCTEYSTCVAPANALPLFQVGAKRYFYSQLLPAMYSLDYFYQVESDIHQPGNIGALIGRVDPSCTSAYWHAPGNAQQPPYQDIVWAYYPAIGVSGNDFLIMNKTDRSGSWPSNYNYIVYPSDDVMAKLTTTPATQTNTSPQNPGLAGGLLFSPDYLFSTHSPMPLRSGTLETPNRGMCNTSEY
ncbi:MAG: hypothetical protein JO150_01410 [Acidobacteriaceae bacterium]|nr:hypothetical protein [Acidobacteriaceae bacterium]